VLDEEAIVPEGGHGAVPEMGIEIAILCFKINNLTHICIAQ
jgi:hypothetical protein